MFLALALGIAPAATFLINWLYVSTRSLIPAVLTHLWFNATAALFVARLDIVYAALGVTWVIGTIALVALTRVQWLRRLPEPPPTWLEGIGFEIRES